MADAHAAETPAAELERWLRVNLPTTWSRDGEAHEARPPDARTAEEQTWYVELGQQGWSVPSWPREYGGRNLGNVDAATVKAVLSKYSADLPVQHFVALELVGPAIMRWGTPDQQRRHLPPIATGQDLWCQLFSEPSAGSDLASLATLAVPEEGTQSGDRRWIINGQKVWSSFAHLSRYGMLLARTDPELPKHAGITCFLLDMDAPGVTVRPITQITGQQHFCEVFLEDVTVADDARLGPLHEGWQVTLSTLGSERSGLSESSSVSGVALHPALALARDNGTWREGAMRNCLADLIATERALTLTNLRLQAEGDRMSSSGMGSITKLVQSELGQRISEAHFELAGPDAAYWRGDDTAPIAYGLLDSRRLTIAGGTSEIQRNIIGERILGLDREPDRDRGRPWRELRRG